MVDDEHRPNPLVFLSSAIKGMATPRIDRTRKSIYDFGQGFGPNAVWVDEYANRRPRDAEPMESVDDFLRELSRSKLCVVLVGTDWPGTGIAVAASTAHTSYFEIELLYAALMGRPLVVVTRQDINPPERIVRILTMLRRNLPATNWLAVDSIESAESAIKRIIERVAHGQFNEFSTGMSAIGGMLLQALWQEREPVGSDARTCWLDHDFLAVPGEPNLAVVEKCLADASRTYVNQQRLSRLWIAARELMSAPFTEPQHDAWLPQWNAVLTAWQRAAAWYGLHGHPYVGYLAALHSLTDVRVAGVRSDPSRRSEPGWDMPVSSLGSAYYAVARRVPSRRLRRAGLLKAKAYLEQTIVADPLTRANVLAIKASVLRELRAFSKAVETYKEVLTLRQTHGASDTAIGEAMSELGYGLLYRLLWRRALATLEEGVRLMEQSPGEPGFLIRGKRKLAVALVANLRFRDARRIRAEIATLQDTFDVGRLNA